MEKNTEAKSSSGPKGSWFKMPSEITLSSELNPYQYRLLAVLLERANLFKTTRKLNTYWSSIGWITSHSGMGETKMRETLNELEGMGFITITRNGTKHKENTFHINWDFINAYQRPRTQKELEEKDELEALSENSIQSPGAKIGKPSIEEWFQQKGKQTLPEKFYSLAEADNSGNKKGYDLIKTAILTSVCEEVSDNNHQDIWDYLLPKFKKYRRWFDDQKEKQRISEKEYYGTSLSPEPSKRTFECGEYWKTNDENV